MSRQVQLAGLLLVAAVWLLPAAATILGHAQLLTSSPGAGETVAVSPAELRLVFSERLVPEASTAEVLDGDGNVLVRDGGMVSDSDPYTLLVPVPQLAPGGYTVQWRNVSEDDGHPASGFFTFGVDVPVPGGRPDRGPGDIHAGHGLVESLIETAGRAASQLGAMAAFGLLLVAFGVVRHIRRGLVLPLIRTSAIALLLGAGGAALVAYVGATTTTIGVGDYLLTTRPGLLLLARMVAGVLLGAAVLVVAARYQRTAVAIAFAGSLVSIALLVGSGHAAAFASPLPLVVAAVHVAAAGVWFVGVAVIAWLGLRARKRNSVIATMSKALPRFSALALVAVGLFILTGIYFAWLQTGALVDLASPYGRLVALKSVLVLVALALGALTYLRLRATASGAIGSRTGVEAAIGVMVIGVTALLASGSPPAAGRPVVIEPAFSSAPIQLDASLGLLPGRSGTNRFIVDLATPLADGAGLTLVIQRADVDQGQARAAMRTDDPARRQWTADATLAGESAAWDVTVVSAGADGIETARSRFTFTLTADGVTAGRASSAIDPATILALAALVVALLSAVYALAGGSPPNTDRSLGRRALLVGSLIAMLLAIAMLVAQ